MSRGGADPQLIVAAGGHSLDFDFDFDFDFDADDRAIGALRSPTPETSQANAAFTGSRSAIQLQRC
ncbi:hypothetical protein LZZ50_06215 [Xanthomonas arboricola]|uniref:hypothetical protein n=1 Tax=Xanthomonas arboricola TaxID=56448 RepID=UPI001FD68264|nr:hypothetical protein [Xanthomonas arboricola]UOS99947.1 hypothetical protein LZZ50_06215 [Xanthomonas arboricola]